MTVWDPQKIIAREQRFSVPSSDDHSNHQHFDKKTDSEVSQDNDLAILDNMDEKGRLEPYNSPSTVPDVNVQVYSNTNCADLFLVIDNQR